MNRGFGFLLAVPIFFIAIFFILETNYIQQETMNFEEYVLNQEVDYAVDAAAQELLEVVDIGTDYQDWGRVSVDPETALNTFQSMMLLSYDFPLTEKSYEMLSTNYIPIFCVAAYDGYYLYELQRTGDNTYYLQGTNKLPYGYEKNGAYYALNLGLDNCRKLYNGRLTIEDLAKEGISKSEVLMQINGQLSDKLTYDFQEYQRARAYNENSFVLNRVAVYIPQGLTTMTNVSAVEGPTVMAFIDGWDLNTTHSVDAFSIGGAKLEPQRMVAGYTSGGVQYYAYADLLPGYEEGVEYPVDIIKLFTTVTEAAKAGYHYDPKYMD